MMKFISCAVVFVFLSTTAHFSVAQTILSDTVINNLYVFTGEYHLSGNVIFDKEAELHFSSGTDILLADSTYLSVSGSISYASDYDSVFVRGQTPNLSSVEVHFFGQAEDSIALRNWVIIDVLLQPQVKYPDSLAIINFHNHGYVGFQNIRVINCGIVQVDDNAITRTFGAVMMNNIEVITIENSLFKKCQASWNGGALTVCNSDSIYLNSSRFYENVAIDSTIGGGLLRFWGQGSSCSIDISNKYLEISKCVFAFDKDCVTTTYFSANTTLIDNSIFYDNSGVSLLTQASVANRTTITSSSFLHCTNAITGGPNLLLKDCVISNDTISYLNRLGRSVEFFVNIPPRYESSNVIYPRGAECLRCGNGFEPYDATDDVLDETTSIRVDGYVFEGVFPLVGGLLNDESSRLCDSAELDIFQVARCIGSAPDIGAVELQQTVSVEERYEEEEISLFPNPTSEHLYIKSDNPWSALKASLISASGKEYRLSVQVIDGETKLLELPDGLAAGLYVVAIYDAEGYQKVGKVLVEHGF